MPMPDKKENHKNTNALAITGLSGKTFTGLSIWKAGAVDIVEIATSSGTQFIKFKQGLCEVNGDANWGSGTQI
jgi:hypothetical protein